jgi:molybdopterin synthase sulfur carrier subunit
MKVKFLSSFRDITKCKEIDVPAVPDVWSLLVQLGEQYGTALKKDLFSPDGTDLNEEMIIFLNGQNISYLGGKNTPLTDADVISVFPQIDGG